MKQKVIERLLNGGDEPVCVALISSMPPPPTPLEYKVIDDEVGQEPYHSGLPEEFLQRIKEVTNLDT